MLEKKIEKYLCDRVKAIGGLQYKFSSPAHRGVPDRIVIYNGKVHFVEVKQDNGRLSSLQKIEHERIREQGLDVFVVWSTEDVDTFIEMIEEEYD